MVAHLPARCRLRAMDSLSMVPSPAPLRLCNLSGQGPFHCLSPPRYTLLHPQELSPVPGHGGAAEGPAEHWEVVGESEIPNRGTHGSMQTRVAARKKNPPCRAISKPYHDLAELHFR